jgi:hypothetical protein
MKYILSLAVLLMLAPACKKDKKKPAAPAAPTTTLLVKEFTDLYTIHYTYDASNKLISVLKQGQFDGEPSVNLGLFTISYNAAGKISEILQEYSGSQTYGWKDVYMYAGDQLSMVDVYKRDEQTGEFNFYQRNSYTYISDDIVDIITHTPTINWYRMRYQTTNGNTTNWYYYTGLNENDQVGLLDIAGLYSEFDSQHYIYESFPSGYNPPYQYVHNAGKYVVGNHTETFSYVYNADGYPIKKTSSDGDVIEYEYEKIPG